MAQKRMFSLSVIDTDTFLDMPQSTQNLYFHLGMRADDDGFIGNCKKIMRMVGASEDDLKVLITKKYIIPFDSGVIVIRHWRLNNYLQNDRHHDTIYQEEKSQLTTDDTNVYNLYTKCIPRIDKNSIDKNRIVESSIENEKIQQQLQKRFIECTGSTNLNAISECLSYLDDMPYEVIEKSLEKTSEKNGGWKYAKTILQNWIKAGIKTIEQVQAEEIQFKNKNNTKQQTKQQQFEKELEEQRRRFLEKHANDDT